MILFRQPLAVSVTAAKWIDSWPRLQFQFFLNLFNCLLTTSLSRRNNRSWAGLPTLFNFQKNGNSSESPLHSMRYLAATRDVHSTTTGCKWLTFHFTTIMQHNQSVHTAWLLSYNPYYYYCKCLCYFSIIIYIVIILITVCTVVIRKHLALNFLSITTEIFSFLIE